MLNKVVQFFKKSPNGVFAIMLLGGIAALAASFTLTLEEFHLFKNPDAVLSCSFNLVLNCAQVMQTWQASVFGFPNMVIGLMAFAVVVTVALAGLAGVKFPRWWLILANIGFLLGMIFSYWLFFSSVYVIEVLCPWCLIVTASTTIIFSSMLHYNLKVNTFKFAKKHNERIQRFLAAGYHQMIVLGWLALMFVLVFMKFGADLFA
ncbi:MAG: vitamin K epoxide reductase family protein [Candidatus Microsaccharimonas sp.]